VAVTEGSTVPTTYGVAPRDDGTVGSARSAALLCRWVATRRDDVRDGGRPRRTNALDSDRVSTVPSTFLGPREAQVAKSPSARRGGRSRRGADAGPEQWLELAGWRKPLDALLALAVTFSAAWLGLVVIPAAANGSDTTIADEPVDASGPTAKPTPDLSEWVAGPSYTGAPAPPTTALATTVETVAAPATQARQPAPRVTPRRTTSRAVPRTTAPRTTAAPVAPAVAAATTAAPPTTETPATSAVLTTSETATSTTTETSSSSSETTTTETPATTTAPATTTPASGG
jgi:hypothetical protein